MTQEQKDQIARIEEMIKKLEIEVLEIKLKDLDDERKILELTRDTGKPKEHNDYFWIDSNGTVYHSEIQPEHQTEFSGYNLFKTAAEAKTEATYTLASRRVRAFAKAVNGEWKADFRDEEKAKWGIVYNPKGMYLDTYYEDNSFIHQISFPTEELAAKALELFREEFELLANP